MNMNEVIVWIQLQNSLSNRFRMGVGAKKKQAEEVTLEHERQLWEKGIFDLNTSEGLSYAVYYYTSKAFGLRGRQEHQDLQVEQLNFGEDPNRSYVEYTGWASKNCQGGLQQRKVKAKSSKQYDDVTNPRSVYKILKLYMIPPSGALYRNPLSGNATEQLRYGECPVGKDTLGKYIKTCMTKAGIDGNFTSHGGKATCATSLYRAKLAEGAIQARVGNRSLDCLRLYDRSVHDEPVKVSAVLDPPSDIVVCESGSKEPPLISRAEAIEWIEKCADDSHPLSVGERGEPYRLVLI